jgi:serine/threonine-protein kinase
MTPDPPPHDEEFTAQLLRLDEDLAAGRRVPASGPAPDSTLDGRLRKGLALVEALQKLRPRRSDRRDVDSIDATTIVRESPPAALSDHVPAVRPGTRLGRFELRRELGRGGFGVVFLALDTRLQREVALKVPHAHALMTADLRSRFQQEARATAALDHPHLVPLYEAGEVGPISYLASAYCPGINLAEWLRRHLAPVPIPDAAALVAKLAEAIAHAHERSIWHRDLKPANVLLVEPGDEPTAPTSTGGDVPELGHYIPKIADFGLAKIVDADDQASRSGVLIGTPAYMAPEQAQGDRKKLSASIDIHALGVILYELLTGRPPFKGEGEVDTLLQVRFDEPLPPRTLRARIPRDLETICLRCLQKDPRHRYPSAQALVDDLHRYLRNEPVHARPIGPLEHAWRFCKRRPLIVGLSAALAAAVVLGVVGVVVQANRAEDAATLAIVERNKAEAERNRAIADRERAERHFKQAREVIARLASAGDELLRHKATEPRGQQVLLDNLEFYKSMLHDRSADSAFRLDAARAMVRAGRMELFRGRYAEAERQFLDARAILEDLLSNPDQRVEALVSAGVALNNYGHCRRDQRDTAMAIQAYDTAIRFLSQARQLAPQHAQARLELANTLVNAGALLHNLNRLPEAEERTLAAIKLQREGVAAAPQAINPRMELALGLDLIGGIKMRQGLPLEAGPAFHEALELRLGASATLPDDPFILRYLGRSYTTLGSYHAQANDWDQARESYERGINILDKAHTLDPQSPHHLVEMAGAHDALADLHRRMGQPDADDRHRRAAIAERRKIVAYWPQMVGTRKTLSNNLSDLGRRLQREKRLPEARAVFEELATLRQDLVSREPHDVALRKSLADAYAGTGIVAGELGDWAVAETWNRKSVEVCETLMREAPSPEYAAALARCRFRVAIALERQDRSRPLVAEWCRQALQANPKHADSLIWLATARADAGVTAAQQVEYARRWSDLQPKAPTAWFALGLTCVRAGQYLDAVQALRKAAELGRLGADDWAAYIELAAAFLTPRSDR